MAKQNVRKIVAELLKDFLPEHGYELYHVEYVREAEDWFLRVTIDRARDGEDAFVSTEDCECVSRYLSEALDREDPIAQNYYLEVSSPGLDRQLFLPEHYRRFAGHMVNVKLYRARNGTKELTAKLIGWENGEILLEEGEHLIRLPEQQVAMVRLAVII